MKETHSLAVKIGRPVFRAVQEKARGHIVSDCPLAGLHIVENVKALAAKDGTEAPVCEPEHPIEIMARAFGLMER
jgi:glycerol-3-phosphate dehydrogenase subunit C